MGRAPVLSVVEVYAPMLALPTPNLAPKPPDPVENQLALGVAHQLIVEALSRFLEGDPPKTLGLRYTSGGHEATPFVVQALGSLQLRRGYLYLTSITIAQIRN
jgi:hypothetical protein